MTSQLQLDKRSLPLFCTAPSLPRGGEENKIPVDITSQNPAWLRDLWDTIHLAACRQDWPLDGLHRKRSRFYWNSTVKPSVWGGARRVLIHTLTQPQPSRQMLLPEASPFPVGALLGIQENSALKRSNQEKINRVREEFEDCPVCRECSAPAQPFCEPKKAGAHTSYGKL
jgi:hypothetical protein